MPWLRKVVRFFLVLTFLFFYRLPVLGDPSNTLSNYSLEYDHIVYLDGNKTIEASGNVCLYSDSLLLTAENLNWNLSFNQIEAWGKVTLTSNDLRILADKLNFNTKSGDFNASNVRSGIGPIVFDASTLNSTNGKVSAFELEGFFGEPHPLDPNFTTSQLIFDQNNTTFSIIQPSILWNRSTLLKLPDLSYDGKTDFLRTKLKFGQQAPLGWYAGLYSSIINQEQISAGSEITFFEERGILLSPRFIYQEKRTDGYSSALLDAGWIRDQYNEKLLDYRSVEISRNRNFARLSLNHRQDHNFRFALQAQRDSDSEIFRDYRRNSFEKNQWNESFGEITYEGELYSISLLANDQLNKHESIIQKTPRILISSGPNNLGGFYHTTSLKYTNSKVLNHFGRNIALLNEYDLGYQVKTKCKIMDGLHYLPSFSVRHINYDLNDHTGSRTLGEWGNDLFLSFHKKYEFSYNYQEIEELLHFMTFNLGHRRVVELYEDNTIEIPDSFYSPNYLNLTPLDLLENQEPGRIHPNEVIRIGWGHSLLAKQDGKYRKLASGRIFYDLWENRPDKILDSNPIYSELDLTLTPWLSLNGRSKFDAKDGRIYRHGAGINIRDGRFHEADITYFRYLNMGESIKFECSKLLTELLEVNVLTIYDLSNDDLPYSSIGFSYGPGRSWVVEFSISERQGTQKEDELELNFGIQILKF